MRRSSYGTGSLFKRGDIWYVAYWLNGKQVQRSSGSADLQAAKRLRDQILGKKARGEINELITDQVTCGELLDDVLEHVKANGKASTHKVWTWCIAANLRPHFGRMKAGKVTSQVLREYRRKRLQEGKSDATSNRELSILRTAMHLGRKQTPPKLTIIPYFPIVRETNVRQGFLTDEQYIKLRDALPDGLKPLFVTAYFTGVRVGELRAWKWEQVDIEQGFVTLWASGTKNGFSRAVPILNGGGSVAFGHHSFDAEFDGKKPVSFGGVVTKVEWINPHSYIYLDVTTPEGKVTNYAVEEGPVGMLRRWGIEKSLLKPGDKIHLNGYASKDGAARGVRCIRSARMPASG